MKSTPVKILTSKGTHQRKRKNSFRDCPKIVKQSIFWDGWAGNNCIFRFFWPQPSFLENAGLFWNLDISVLDFLVCIFML